MLDTRGNTAVYLQFAHARLASILRKAQDELHVDLAALKASPEKVSVEHDSERALAFELLVFSDVIEVSLTMKAWRYNAPLPRKNVQLELAHSQTLAPYPCTTYVGVLGGCPPLRSTWRG